MRIVIILVMLSSILSISSSCATHNQQPSSSSSHPSHTSEKTDVTPESDTDKYLGVVKNGEFQCIWPKRIGDAHFRLTTISRMAAMAPEGAEVDLSQYEGYAVMVQGHRNSGWIYDAHIIDNAKPIITTVVHYLFSKSEKTELILVPDTDKYLGMVKNGEFLCLWPKRTSDIPLKLTKISMVAGMAPEGAKLDLSQYEGRAVMVQGHESGSWIYDARIIDNADPILTTVVQHIFSKE